MYFAMRAVRSRSAPRRVPEIPVFGRVPPCQHQSSLRQPEVMLSDEAHPDRQSRPRCCPLLFFDDPDPDFSVYVMMDLDGDLVDTNHLDRLFKDNRAFVNLVSTRIQLLCNVT